MPEKFDMLYTQGCADLNFSSRSLAAITRNPILFLSMHGITNLFEEYAYM